MMKTDSKKLHFWTVLLFLLNLQVNDQALAEDTCGKCSALKNEIEQFKKQLAITHHDLENEQAKIKELAETSLPKKMQTTSNVFVLVAKIETLQNDIKGNEIDLKKLKCVGCTQKSSTSTLPQSKSSSSSH